MTLTFPSMTNDYSYQVYKRNVETIERNHVFDLKIKGVILKYLTKKIYLKHADIP